MGRWPPPAGPRCSTSTGDRRTSWPTSGSGAGWAGNFQVPCARCVEPVEIPLAADYDLIFRPAAADSEATERSITAQETEIGYYQRDSLALDDVLREQVLLSLPVRTLCKPDCKGLCPNYRNPAKAGDCRSS